MTTTCDLNDVTTPDYVPKVLRDAAANYRDIEGTDALLWMELANIISHAALRCERAVQHARAKDDPPPTDAPQHVSTYSFRAECASDVAAFERRSVDAGIRMSADIRELDHGEFAVELRTHASLAHLRAIMRNVFDSHVMLETLRACPLSDNSLERDHTVT